MLAVLRDSWALLLGLLLLMVGNGLQGSLLGVRGAIEGMSPTTLSWVMSSYFAGFLIGARLAPKMIRRVGHVRVFAAMASIVSAAFILFAAWPDPWFWSAMRFVVGLSFAAVYIVTESWLNDRATNETRGQAMSLYVIVQTGGVASAQAFLNLADPGGWLLFVLISVLVSISFAPILLSVTPAPPYDFSEPMSVPELFRASPLGAAGSIALGGIFSAMFAMSAVFGAERGLSVREISIFIASIYLGGLALQYPIGWISDRMDRRKLIVGVSFAGAATGLVGFAGADGPALIVVGALMGGAANPLYSLMIAHINDFLPTAKMASAAAAISVLTGLGAIGGPIAAGALMEALGADAYFLYIALCMLSIAFYGSYRMTQRPGVSPEDSGAYAAYWPSATPVAVEMAQEALAEAIEAEAETDAAEQDLATIEGDDRSPA